MKLPRANLDHWRWPRRVPLPLDQASAIGDGLQTARARLRSAPCRSAPSRHRAADGARTVATNRPVTLSTITAEARSKGSPRLPRATRAPTTVPISTIGIAKPATLWIAVETPVSIGNRPATATAMPATRKPAGRIDAARGCRRPADRQAAADQPDDGHDDEPGPRRSDRRRQTRGAPPAEKHAGIFGPRCASGR